MTLKTRRLKAKGDFCPEIFYFGQVCEYLDKLCYICGFSNVFDLNRMSLVFEKSQSKVFGRNLFTKISRELN